MRRKYYYVIVAALMLSLAGCVSDKQDNQKEQGNITTEGSQKDQDNVTTEHGQAQDLRRDWKESKSCLYQRVVMHQREAIRVSPV